MITIENLKTHIDNLREEKAEDFFMADGADSNYHYLEGYVDCLEHLIETIEGK